MRGLYIAVESVDGGGKGTIIRGFAQYHQERGQTVFRLDESVWAEDSLLEEIYGTSDRIPRYAVLKDILAKKNIFPDAYIVCEPTFSELGKHIREVLAVHENQEKYPPMVRIHAFAEDRNTLLERFILPALEDGKNIYSERNVTSSLVYQSVELNCDFGVIAKIPGNSFALRHIPKHTVIAAIDVEKAMRNLDARTKKDNSFFETTEFQQKTLIKYLSDELKQFLEYHGTRVTYLDIPAESTPEDTIKKAQSLLAGFLGQKSLHEF